jgi:hypothetical protein
MLDIENLISPYNLLQERQLAQRHPAWRLLVVSHMVHMARYTPLDQVEPVANRFLTTYASPSSMLFAEPVYVKEVLHPLGIVEHRYRYLKYMSTQYLEMLRNDRNFVEGYNSGDWASTLQGCGMYAVWSLDLFLYGMIDLPTRDHLFEKYRMWRIERRDLRRRGLA